MLSWETFICRKCGKPFTAAVGGIIMSPKEMELRTYPICNKCKLQVGTSIFRSKNK